MRLSRLNRRETGLTTLNINLYLEATREVYFLTKFKINHLVLCFRREFGVITITKKIYIKANFLLSLKFKIAQNKFLLCLLCFKT